jgi:hypothetical protein
VKLSQVHLPGGIHLDGESRAILKSKDGWDINATPEGLIVKFAEVTYWIPSFRAESGVVANDNDKPKAK